MKFANIFSSILMATLLTISCIGQDRSDIPTTVQGKIIFVDDYYCKHVVHTTSPHYNVDYYLVLIRVKASEHVKKELEICDNLLVAQMDCKMIPTKISNKITYSITLTKQENAKILLQMADTIRYRGNCHPILNEGNYTYNVIKLKKKND